jgi:arylsulfatase B
MNMWVFHQTIKKQNFILMKYRMKRIYFFLALLILTKFNVCFAKQKPNIIFILADDMGYSDMSWQGSPIQTPNLDKLVKNGMFLERNYAQPQCTPSRVALLTGNYPFRYGLHEHIVLSSSFTGIPAGVKTIAGKMKEGGYETAVIGKWHVGGHKQSYLPHNLGFDHSFVCINGAISYWNYTHEGVNDLIRNGKKVIAPSKVSGEESGNTYSTYLWADEATQVINQHDKNRPLFMYLAFNAPHYPLDAPQKILDKYSEDTIAGYWAGPNAERGRKANTRKSYLAMVDAMDKAIGDVIEAVEKNGMKENTLIVFCSDNGGIIEADNRPLRSIKGDSFEGGVRVPGIACWPGKIKAGSKSRELVHMSDWYPTFAELAGLNVEKEGLDGKSAVGILNGKKGKRKVVPIISAGRHALISSKFALVGSTENYQRAVNNDLSEFQLFNLEEDISQKQPTESFPGIKKEMKKQMLEYFSLVQRGYFNWDIKYAKYRLDNNKVEHNFDRVINDQPILDVSHSGNKTTVSISPVSNKLLYKLQGSADGQKWMDLDEYICRKDAEKYIFPSLIVKEYNQQYRVQTADHFGLPIHDSFSLGNAYKIGTIYTVSNSALMKNFLPPIDGFLSIADVSGGNQVRIINENLAYKNFPLEGGAMELTGKSQDLPVYVTRYFIEPQSIGKVYASLLVQFQALEAESIGEINWLVQNGWNGPTEKQASLCFQNDGIYFKQADPPKGQDSINWLANNNNKVVFVVFEFDLGATGQDKLNIYINPENAKNMIPSARYHGEFTFDRLQFALNGRTGGTLRIDDIRVGRKLEEVIY